VRSSAWQVLAGKREKVDDKKQKLELTWIGKENRPKLEPRILLEDREKSYHASHRVADHDLCDNRLALKVHARSNKANAAGLCSMHKTRSIASASS
jgi:hypothetical protein